MIRVNKNINNAPISLTNALASANYASIINTTLPNHKENIKPSIYRSADVVKQLKIIYNNKCAYCEGKKYNPEVEHYRPKKKVTDDNLHPGYYWLCYEWSNLLAACHDCNKQGAKGNHFPIAGIRIAAPIMLGGTISLADNQYISTTLQGQTPLILNPEDPTFNPTIYFRFTINGEMEEIPAVGTIEYRKAFETINILKLNRDDLTLNERRKEIVNYTKRLKLHLLRLLCDEIKPPEFERAITDILTEIKSKTTPQHEYSFFWRYFYLNFSRFIEVSIKPKYRNKVYCIVNNYVQANQI